MTWLDSVITWLNPEQGERRKVARYRMEFLTSAYEGARKGRTTEGWTTSAGDANEDIKWDLDTLRERSRDLVRNTPHAHNAVRMLTSQLVGTGITPLVTGAGKKAVNDAWRWFSDEADFDGDTDYFGLQALSAQTMIESGEALIVRRRPPASLGLRVPLQIQVLEPDYIDTVKDQELPGGGFVVAGVEFDSAARRVAYWLFDRHPGSKARRLESKRVPAADVIHLFRKDRPGAVRAAPWLAPVTLKARDMADYDRAELFAKKLQACISEFIKTGEADPKFGERKTDPVTGRAAEKMQIGQRVRLRPDEDVTLSAPPIVPGYSDYSRKNLRDFAAGVGLTYEALTADLSQVNYSSFRAGHIYFNAHYERLRWHLMVPKCCNRVWDWFADAAAAVGLMADDTPRPGWVTPAYQSVDPLKDYRATLLAVRGTLKSLPQAVAEQGYDFETHLDEVAEANDALDEREITSDSDPRRTTASGGPANGTTTNGDTDGNTADDGPTDEPTPEPADGPGD